MTPEQLAQWRRDRDISQETLAVSLRLGKGGQVTVARWETGERGIPRLLPLALEALKNSPHLWTCPECGSEGLERRWTYHTIQGSRETLYHFACPQCGYPVCLEPH